MIWSCRTSFLGRLAEHGDGIALIFARTETEVWFKHVWGKASGILFLQGRLTFHHADGQAARYNGGAASALIAYGHSNLVALWNAQRAGKIKGKLIDEIPS